MNTFFFDDVQYPEGLFGGKDFFNPIIYSTEEREVGVWIDNKPLYQRTYQTTELLVDNSGADISSYIDNQAEIENYINAYAVNTANPKQSANVFIGIGDGNRVVVYCAEVGRFNSFTVWYTKTADVAGSAQYTTLGVPAHHYDGNEKIIGTWFGATLYEKTVTTGGEVPSGATLIERQAQVGHDTILYTKA